MPTVENPNDLTVVAFGGNALMKPGERGLQSEQASNSDHAARTLVGMLGDQGNLLLVHGNGPQVGNILIQVEEAVTKVPPLSLDVCVAQSEGSMGYMLERSLRNELKANALRRDVASVLTQVVVDRDDPRNNEPTKPIGPWYSPYRADYLIHEKKWIMIEDSGRGYRKVVPSPKPLEILELEAVRGLLNSGFVVIAGGGGGIPVIRDEKGRLEGFEAVIDKDYVAAMFAKALGSRRLIVLTGVPCVYSDFGLPTQEPLHRISVSEAKSMLDQDQFPKGSMRPKIEASLDYLSESSGEVLITSAEHLAAAVNGGKEGTWILPE